MSGGRIYIDPDTVSNVSSQMSRSADEIESLSRNIIPQVNEVINMGLGTHMPSEGSYSLVAAQDSMAYFERQSQVMVLDLRTSARVLYQVAEEGWQMDRELLQKATIFTAPGQGGSSSTSSSGNSSHDFWHSLFDYINTSLGIGGGILDKISKLHPELEGLKYFLKYADPALAVLGVGIDIWSGGHYDPRTIVTDILGGGVQYAVGLTPWGGAALFAAGAIHLGGPVVASGQDWLGDVYGGQIGQELKQPAEGLKTGAENVNLTPIFDDVGRLILDSNGTGTPLAPTFMGLNTIAGAFGVTLSDPGQLPSDLGQTVSDGWKLDKAVNQVVVNGMAMGVDDGLALGDKVVQNLPLPNGVKGIANTATSGMIGAVNDTANFITNSAPKGIENIAGDVFHAILP